LLPLFKKGIWPSTLTFPMLSPFLYFFLTISISLLTKLAPSHGRLAPTPVSVVCCR
jgi:hypothetical protein